MNNAIRIQNVSKKFGRKLVLDNVSLDVPTGVVFALLGENGAGKSTLIRGLLGYHRWNQGTTEVLGMDPLSDPLELRRRVGYVADAPGLYEWMTVAQAGWYAASFYPNGFVGRYDQLTHEFGLSSEAKIRDLSKGMRAKVALALAIAFDPELLVLDEPTSGLDPVVRRSFLESMIDRAALGKTVLISSHQIHEVERIADWVAILHEGRIQVAAPLEDLKQDVAMLTYSLKDPLLAAPQELDAVEVLHQSTEGRTVTCMVRGMEPTLFGRLQENANLFDVKTIRPNLEELYIGFTQPLAAKQMFEQESNAEVA